MNVDCLFCKIIKKEIPSTIVFEDKEAIAFKDIHPKAPTHLLFIPKEHIESVLTLTEETKEVPTMLLWKAKEFAASQEIPGYKLTFHCGREGGQVVDHIHLHLMAEKKI